jgi:heavy metal sensor kinase
MSALLRWPTSVRARLTVWYTLVLGAPLVLFAAASFLVLERALHRRTDNFLEAALAAFGTSLRGELYEMPTTKLAIRAALTEFRFRDLQLVVMDSSSRIVDSAAPGRGTDAAAQLAPHAADAESDVFVEPEAGVDLSRIDAGLAGRPVAERIALTLDDDRGGYRLHARPVTLRGEVFRIVAAYPLHGIRDTLAAVGVAYLVAIPLLLLAAALGGYFLATRGLSPVSAMIGRAAEISATNLHERLPVENPGDELGRLATVVNGLLARLEGSFAHQRRFMADASHELRTPVAILRTEADVTLTREHRSEEEYRESATVIRDASRRLGRIVDDLFLLARADSGHLPVRRDDVYLDEIVHEAARSVRALATDRGIRVELVPLVDAPFRGDADLLGRLLLNLLDNAIKFSPRGSTVVLALARREGHYEIRVADSGPGIAPEAQAQVFDRFFRVDKTRARGAATDSAGAGLGLAIARWIAESHGGSLVLARSDATGSEFIVTLPWDMTENPSVPAAELQLL